MHMSSAVERIWHTQDSQGKILAFAFRQKSSKPFKLFPPLAQKRTSRKGDSLLGEAHDLVVHLIVLPVN